jgi:DNA repair protein REV1
VVASNLTPAKALEFKHMKVVRPDWLLDSAAANKLLPWSDYRWVQQADVPSQLLVPDTPLPMSSFPPLQVSPERPTDIGTPGLVLGSTDKSLLIGSLSAPEPVQPAGEAASPAELGPSLVLPASEPGIIHLPDPLLHIAPPAAPAGPSRPSYAAHTSNPQAERLMESAEWREAHTSASGEAYIQGYYQHSRLHHLSKWKAELRSLVAKAQEEAEAQISGESGPSMLSVDALDSRRKDKGKSRASDKVIMHCDFDSFFVAAGIVARPELKGKPVVVCHASGKGDGHSTSEIASASYAARAFGVRNGMRWVVLCLWRLQN